MSNLLSDILSPFSSMSDLPPDRPLWPGEEELIMNLKNSLHASGIPPHRFARKAKVWLYSVDDFLSGKGRKRMKRRVIEKIEKEMRRRGWLGTKELPEEHGFDPVDSAVDSSLRPIILSGGPALTDLDKVDLIYVIRHAPYPVDRQNELIRKLMGDTFPNL